MRLSKLNLMLARCMGELSLPRHCQPPPTCFKTFRIHQSRKLSLTAEPKVEHAKKDWPRRVIEPSEVITAEFGADFGNYKVVTVDPNTTSTGIHSQLRNIPAKIPKPEYYKTGIPRNSYILNNSSSLPIRREPEIKSKEQIQKLKEACQLARFVLISVSAQAKPGVTTDQLDEFAHNLIVSKGAYPSPLNYRGFPKSICTSVNNVACHGIPDERKLEDGDIINIDVTVFLNGFHGDCSETVLVGNVDPIGQRLVKVAEDCLYEGIRICGPKVPFQNIGKAIQSMAEEKGFTVIPAFTGHGIGEYFHGPPDIYHIDYNYPGVMEEGMTFTVEPILSQGQEEAVEIQDDGWTATTVDNSRAAQFEHTILITSSGAEILTDVK